MPCADDYDGGEDAEVCLSLMSLGGVPATALSERELEAMIE